MIRERFRVHFSKEGDLRLISHRDLVRTFERLFRRAQLQLSMSEGFHPKARMTFPSALALGIEGQNEVMELELAEEMDEQQLAERLRTVAPAGLVIRQVRRLTKDERKAQIQRAIYEVAVPSEQHDAVTAAIADLLAQRSCIIQRPGRQPIDVRADLDELRLHDGRLTMRLLVGAGGSARAREVLEVLGLSELESQGHYLTRTEVELAP